MIESSIERGLPIPLRPRQAIEQQHPELLALEVGDSFLIRKAPLGIHIAVAMFGIKNDQRHEVRQVEGDDYRVWRTR
jgi:hypothetical protein